MGARPDQFLHLHPPTLHPTSQDIAWAAGIVEGEGHIRHNTRTIYVTVTQKEREILDRLACLFGGSVRPRYWKTSNHFGGNGFAWHLCGARAAGFTMTIYRFLSARRKDQAKGAIALWKEAKKKTSKVKRPT